MNKFRIIVIALCIFQATIVFAACDKKMEKSETVAVDSKAEGMEENKILEEDNKANNEANNTEILKENTSHLDNSETKVGESTEAFEEESDNREVSNDRVEEKGERALGKEEQLIKEEKKINVIEKSEYIQNWDEALMKYSVESGFPSINEEVEKVEYEPTEADRIKFDYELDGMDLYISLRHSGFDSLVITYENKRLSWSEFFDEYDYSETIKNRIVSLKNQNVYEEEAEDEYAKTFKYYRSDSGISYEINELLMGNFLEEKDISKLDKKIIAKSYYFDAIEGIDNPTYNPIPMSENEFLVDCKISGLDGKSVIYIEKVKKNDKDYKLIKQWISIRDGLEIKRYEFSSDGVIEKINNSTSIEYKELDDSIFVEPYDVEYKDETFFVYSFVDKGVEALKSAFKNTFVDEPFSLTLSNKENIKMTLFSEGIDMKKIAVVTSGKNSKDEAFDIIQYYDGAYFNSIIPSKKIVEKYTTSCRHLKLFDFFDMTGFRGRMDSENTITYTFEDLGLGSVSGHFKFYEYVIDKSNNKISGINIYSKEALRSKEIIGAKDEYVISDIKEGNMNIFEIPTDYKVYTNNTHYDGENPPAWWE